MSTFLSLLGVAAFIVSTITVAAAVTWSVIRVAAVWDRQKPS